MAVEMFHDQMSKKDCAGRGDQTRGRLHAKQTRFQSSYRAWSNGHWDLWTSTAVYYNKQDKIGFMGIKQQVNHWRMLFKYFYNSSITYIIF